MNEQTTTNAILAYLRQCDEDRIPMPTYREIAQKVGIASVSTVGFHLHKLKRDGYIELYPGIARGIRVLDKRAGV